MVQVIRAGQEIWEVHKTRELWKGTTEYEIIGKVLRDGDYYYVEVPVWGAKGYTWLRQPKQYALPVGAIKAIINGPKKVLQ